MTPLARASILSPYRSHDGPVMAGGSTSALSWYTSEFARALRAYREVTVLAPYESDRRPWRDGDVAIEPVYRRGRADVALQIARALDRTRPPVLHVEHELYAYGGVASAFALPFAMARARRNGGAIVTTVHGVLPLATIDRAFVASNGIRIPVGAARALWRELLRNVCRASDVVHVHEAEHRARLRDEYGVRARIETREIGVTPQSHGDRATARAALGIAPSQHALLFFGFMLERKGIVPLLEAADALLANDPELVIVLAGTVPDRVAGATTVAAHLERLHDRGRVRRLGFVADAEVARVFAAADAFILPYTISIAASGPMSLAIGHGLPMLLSEVFRASYPQAGPFFPPTRDGIVAAVTTFFADAAARRRGAEVTNRLAASRTWPAFASWASALYADVAGLRTRISA